jgi:hypothetical protein
MDARLNLPFRLLRFALGLTATVAGLDKFFNILADWGAYVSPLAILAAAPRPGAYVASAWLLLVAFNLALGGHFDIAVRDVVMSIAAFTLARALEVPATAEAMPIR